MFRSYKDLVRVPVKANKDSVKKYYCDLCPTDNEDRVWDCESDIEIHRRREHKTELFQMMKNPTNYMCHVCLRPQKDRPSLIAHIKTNHLLSSPEATRVKRELFVCEYCNNIFFNKLLLAAHIKSYHLRTQFEQRIDSSTCPICYKPVKIKQMWFHFLYHGIIHTGTCPVCLNSFEDYQEALEHAECHPGYYHCNICGFNTDREGLFLNHTDKHKKKVNLEGKDVDMVKRFFVPQKRTPSWNRKVVNFYKGIMIAPEIHICILCRALCETKEEMLHHIYGDHSQIDMVEVKRYKCVCGEEFFNSVLLKHHIFKLKGEHRVSDGTEIPKHLKKSVSETSKGIVNNDKQKKLIMRDKEEGLFVIEIKESDLRNKNIANSITIPVQLGDDTTLKPITFPSQNETETDYCMNYSTLSKPHILMESQNYIELEPENEVVIKSEDEINIHSQNSLQSEQETVIEINYNDAQIINIPREGSNRSQNKVKTQTPAKINIDINSEMNTTSKHAMDTHSQHDMYTNTQYKSSNDFYPIQSHDTIQPMKHNVTQIKTGSKKVIKVNNIYKNKVILKSNGNSMVLENQPKEVSDSSSIKNQLINDNINSNNRKTHSPLKNQKRVYNSPQKPLLLNSTLPKRYLSSKEFYEQMRYEITETFFGERPSNQYKNDSSKEQSQNITGSSLKTDVSEVMIIPDDENEDSGENIEEEILLGYPVPIAQALLSLGLDGAVRLC